jgi:hypothetical protein
VHPLLERLPDHERPKPNESATDYWLRLQDEKPPQTHGPRLLTPQTMNPQQRRQYHLRLNAGMDCWDALTAVVEL